MVERFLAMILALMAAIFSTDMASESELETSRKHKHYISILIGQEQLWR